MNYLKHIRVISQCKRKDFKLQCGAGNHLTACISSNSAVIIEGTDIRMSGLSKLFSMRHNNGQSLSPCAAQQSGFGKGKLVAACNAGLANAASSARSAPCFCHFLSSPRLKNSFSLRSLPASRGMEVRQNYAPFLVFVPQMLVSICRHPESFGRCLILASGRLCWLRAHGAEFEQQRPEVAQTAGSTYYFLRAGLNRSDGLSVSFRKFELWQKVRGVD